MNQMADIAVHFLFVTGGTIDFSFMGNIPMTITTVGDVILDLGPMILVTVQAGDFGPVGLPTLSNLSILLKMTLSTILNRQGRLNRYRCRCQGQKKYRLQEEEINKGNNNIHFSRNPKVFVQNSRVCSLADFSGCEKEE